eukprot:TRINITY_DN6737_c0_g1_i3.p1 TRINITY_DN6737_c0_g1~~TRINITY_DN6737_c0_g1_i3.p1  ORF type:complete len:767 (+),score=58.34 TRINITY_DN6737_c0_g1_i3:94-2301(+)
MGCCFGHLRWWLQCLWWSDRREGRRGVIALGATSSAEPGHDPASPAQKTAIGDPADRAFREAYLTTVMAGLAVVQSMRTVTAAATIAAMPILAEVATAKGIPGGTSQASLSEAGSEKPPRASPDAATPHKAPTRRGSSGAPSGDVPRGPLHGTDFRSIGKEEDDATVAMCLDRRPMADLEEEETAGRRKVERGECAARADTELREESSRVGQFVVGMRVVARCAIGQDTRTVVKKGEVGIVQNPLEGCEGVRVKFDNHRQKVVVVPESSLISKRQADARTTAKTAAAGSKDAEAAVAPTAVSEADEPGEVGQRQRSGDIDSVRSKRASAGVAEATAPRHSTGALSDDDSPRFNEWHKAARKGARAPSAAEPTLTTCDMVQLAKSLLKQPHYRQKWRALLLANHLSGEERPEDMDREELCILLNILAPGSGDDRMSQSPHAPAPTSGAAAAIRRPGGPPTAHADSRAQPQMLGAAAGQQGVGRTAKAQGSAPAGQGAHAALRAQRPDGGQGHSAGRGRGAPLPSPSAARGERQGQPRGSGRGRGASCPVERGHAARGIRHPLPSAPEPSPRTGSASSGAFALARERHAVSPRRAPPAEPAVAPGTQEALTFAEAARGARTATGACATAASGPSPGAGYELRDGCDPTAPLLHAGGGPDTDDYGDRRACDGGRADSGEDLEPDAVAHALSTGVDYLLTHMQLAAPLQPPAAPAGSPAVAAAAVLPAVAQRRHGEAAQ